MRGNQIFFTDQSGLRRLENTTILPGVVGFGADQPYGVAYASSVDRVYVSVISGTTYIAAVTADPFGLFTTFNNALAYQFNYLKYSAFKDRLFATQSDGTNLWGRVINPHTNTIPGNFQFSTNAAHEFQGGIAYYDEHDEIWCARQTDLNPFSQTIEIFDGTSFAFSVEMALNSLTPNNLIYVRTWGYMIAIGSDANLKGQVLFIEPGSRSIKFITYTNTASAPTEVVYDSFRNEIAVDCATEILFLSMSNFTITDRIAKPSISIQMAYDESRRKVYCPMAGTNTIETFG